MSCGMKTCSVQIVYIVYSAKTSMKCSTSNVAQARVPETAWIPYAFDCNFLMYIQNLFSIAKLFTYSIVICAIHA